MRKFCTSFLTGLFSFALLAGFNPTVTAQQNLVPADFQKHFKDLPTVKETDEGVTFNYHPEKGDEWKYRMILNSEMDIMGMKMPKYDEVVIKYTIDSTDEEGFQFTSSIVELIGEMSTRGGGYRIDNVNPEKEYADPNFRALLEMWKGIREQTLTCGSTKTGKIVGLEVPQGITDAVEGQAGAYGINPRDLTSFFITGMMNVPDSAVSSGDKWDFETAIIPMGAESSDEEAAFLGIAEQNGRKLAVFIVNLSVINEDGDGRVTDMELETKTLAYFDIEQGNLWRAYGVTATEMVIKIGDNEMLQEMTGTSTLFRVDE